MPQALNNVWLTSCQPWGAGWAAAPHRAQSLQAHSKAPPCQRFPPPAPANLNLNTPQTWLKLMRADSLENNSPWAALLVLWDLQLSCVLLFNKTRRVHSASHREPRHSPQHGRSDFPLGSELTEHIPTQPTYTRCSTSATRNCINKFTQVSWSTPPGTVLSLYQKPLFPVEQVPFLLKPTCLLLLRQALMPAFHTQVIKWNIFPSNHWMVLRHLFLKVTLQGFHPVSLYLF